MGKRSRGHRDRMAPPAFTIHSATTGDAIVTFGEGYGALLVPVERRVAKYLRQENLLAVGGQFGICPTPSCFSLGPDMLTARYDVMSHDISRLP